MIANFISPNWNARCLIQLDTVKLPLSPSDVNKAKNFQLALFVALATLSCCYLYVSKHNRFLLLFGHVPRIGKIWGRKKKKRKSWELLFLFFSPLPLSRSDYINCEKK